MPEIKLSKVFRIINRGIINLIRKKPIAISLEVTHSCNCNCEHCDKGGKIPDENLAPPERFGNLVRELKPIVAQISGGEPFLRDDIYEIVKQLNYSKFLPHLVFITNGWLLTEKKYLKLKQLGINEFGISLDFPDERHDENRKLPGLFKHLDKLLPKLASYNNNDITLISVIRKESLPELRKLTEQAVKWGVNINFSTYTPLRTGDKSKSINTDQDLTLLRKQIDYLIDFKLTTGKIFTYVSTLNRYYDFFASGSNLPPCKAGCRSLVINPGGKLAPCAMKPYSFNTIGELKKKNSDINQCGGCMVSLRANTEKSFGTFLKDSWLAYKQMRNNSCNN